MNLSLSATGSRLPTFIAPLVKAEARSILRPCRSWTERFDRGCDQQGNGWCCEERRLPLRSSQPVSGPREDARRSRSSPRSDSRCGRLGGFGSRQRGPRVCSGRRNGRIPMKTLGAVEHRHGVRARSVRASLSAVGDHRTERILPKGGSGECSGQASFGIPRASARGAQIRHVVRARDAFSH